MAVAAILFILSLVLLVALFAIKDWEVSHGYEFAPALRRNADREALHMKSLLAALVKDAGKLPFIVLDAGEATLQAAATDFGHLAIWLGREAHNLANRVSRRGAIQPRETRSDFLRQVAEHKNEVNGATLH